ncbi:Vacuolar fusion protein [Yarrowia sp. C11]|nr:Vacuolar fusion protein [Yarrowia sp. E02]KAG5373267.1 Vacuolar fusion protein [Yarrowia sp. C11]
MENGAKDDYIKDIYRHSSPPHADSDSLVSSPTVALDNSILSTSNSLSNLNLDQSPQPHDDVPDIAEVLQEMLATTELPSANTEAEYEPELDFVGGHRRNNLSQLNNELRNSPRADSFVSLDPPSIGTEVEQFLSKKKQFFILSSAGKPIYTLHGSDDVILGYLGVLQTVVSAYQADGSDDNLMSFRAGKTLVVVAVEGPLILAAVSKIGESESQLRAQLDVLYTQILSTLTKNQIHRIYANQSNFDLRNLLQGTDVYLDALTREIVNGSPSILLGALEPLILRKSIREEIDAVLLNCRTPSLLYGLIVSDSKLANVIRPKKHSLHPPDLILLFSMLFNTTSFRDGEHWVPICLPKFNSTGFLYAYIHFFSKSSALIQISADKNAFFELRDAKQQILAQMADKGLIKALERAEERGRFKPVDVAVPMVRHFLYKSRAHVQYVMPSYETHYHEPHLQRGLVTFYHQLHAQVNSASSRGSNNGWRFLHLVRNSCIGFAWITPSFELYCVSGPNVSRATLAASIHSIAKWVSQHRERLFVIGGAVF